MTSGLKTQYIRSNPRYTCKLYATIELFIQEETTSEWKRLKIVVTNYDGRLDDPLLPEEEMKIGIYLELVFHVGEYFRKKDVILPDPPFIELVPVRFGNFRCNSTLPCTTTGFTLGISSVSR